MGPRANERDFVIKVKCGDTPKRFSTYIYGDMIDHNMTRLRKKIINLFKLSPEADFVRIYIDVDGDIVALDDDDELHETAINQPLNPLRISVLLRSNASDGHDLKHENMSSATAVPPQVDKQPFEFSSVINEAFRSVPEQFCTALSNISHDFLSKAASSAPAIADVLDHFSKLEIPSCSQTVNSSTGESSGTPSQLTSQPKNHNISREPKVPSTSAPVSTILIQFQRTCMSMSVVMEIREASSMALQLQLIFLFQMACTPLAILTRGMMYIMITAILFTGELDVMAVECTQSLVHDSDL